MAKKCDKDEKLVVDKPRILLKPKDKEHSESAQASSSSSSTQISIAARPIEPSSSNSDAIKVNRLQPVHHASASSRDSKDSHASAHTSSNETSTPTTAASEPKLPTMKHPISIISDHYQIQNHVQDYLIETNTDFMVIGVIGTQGAGKSFIMNMLIDDVTNFDDVEHINRLVGRRSGVFEMRNHSGDTLSNMPVTEGIEMYVTRHRTILLDCSPILCNPYKKEAIFNELDDLKMVIFLLSVCNTLIVVEDCGFNIHLMRLLMMADSMKVDVFETDLNEQRYSPNILIFKNKCRNCDFTVEAKQRTSNLYRAFFVCSGLKMVSGAAGRNLERKANGSNDDVPDVFYFPWIDSNGKFSLASFFGIFGRGFGGIK